MEYGKVEFIKNIPDDKQMGENNTLYIDDSCNFYIYKNPNFLSKSYFCFCKFTNTSQIINTIKNIFNFNEICNINNNKTLNCELSIKDSIFKIKSEFFLSNWKISFYPGKIKYNTNNYNITFSLYTIENRVKNKIVESHLTNTREEYDSGIFIEYIKVHGSTNLQLEVNSDTDNIYNIENSNIIFEQIS